MRIVTIPEIPSLYDWLLNRNGRQSNDFKEAIVPPQILLSRDATKKQIPLESSVFNQQYGKTTASISAALASARIRRDDPE